ncbi:hypothetical protein I6A60_00590 [Frankia sp. AgB1.9]|uniref:hypothetical protein n=1 Tax=unclassified Frankia TaxID=2632575 RepID=UPI0019337628|nr:MULTISPECIES: hypothetical protein [unclassified Frankia]MBL7487378.1 hypothetical protein [Frankia sp. AgW1.1]MBL7546386.1 hypothetical protein [Frankia sp. AgB1.9]MBL7618569.1 hypothetical protein [Frankia sp. AgB1.8]
MTTSAGAASVAGWIGEPATKDAIRDAADQLGDPGPLAALDDVEALELAYRVFGSGVGTTPAEAAAMTDWLDLDRWVNFGVWWWAVRQAVRLRDLATVVGVKLAAAGVLPTPLWPGDLATIAFAVLRADRMPWDESPAVLADLLQPVDPVWAAGTGESRIRPGLRGHTRQALDRWIIAVEDWVAGSPVPQAPYAGVSQRTPGAQQLDAERRREAVRQVLARWPGVDAADFRIEAGGRLSPPAEALQAERDILGLPAWPKSAYGTGPHSKRRDIRRDLAFLRLSGS